VTRTITIAIALAVRAWLAFYGLQPSLLSWFALQHNTYGTAIKPRGADLLWPSVSLNKLFPSSLTKFAESVDALGLGTDRVRRFRRGLSSYDRLLNNKADPGGTRSYLQGWPVTSFASILPDFPLFWVPTQVIAL
jgi:hypothetical protein